MDAELMGNLSRVVHVVYASSLPADISWIHALAVHPDNCVRLWAVCALCDVVQAGAAVDPAWISAACADAEADIRQAAYYGLGVYASRHLARDMCVREWDRLVSVAEIGGEAGCVAVHSLCHILSAFGGNVAEWIRVFERAGGAEAGSYEYLLNILDLDTPVDWGLVGSILVKALCAGELDDSLQARLAACLRRVSGIHDVFSRVGVQERLFLQVRGVLQ